MPEHFIVKDTLITKLAEVLDPLVSSLEVRAKFKKDKTSGKHVDLICQTNCLIVILFDLDLLHRLLRGFIHRSSGTN